MSQPPIVQISGRASRIFDVPCEKWTESSNSEDMETFKSRLIDAAQHFGIGIGPSAIADWLGIDNRQVVHNWFGTGKPSAKHLPRFRDKGINTDWLLTGRGAMLVPSEKHNVPALVPDKDLQEIQSAWDNLYPKQRQGLKETLLDLASTIARANSARSSATKGLPNARPGGSGKRAKNGQPARRRGR